MKALMLKTHLGAEDGINIKEYKAGEVYDLPAFFYEPWCVRGLCEFYEETKIEEPKLETKIEKPKRKPRTRKSSKK